MIDLEFINEASAHFISEDADALSLLVEHEGHFRTEDVNTLLRIAKEAAEQKLAERKVARWIEFYQERQGTESLA